MSEANLQVVRRGIEAFNAGDPARFAELATDDFVWKSALSGAVGVGPYVGRPGIDRYFEESRDTWERLTVQPDELREAGDLVVFLGRAVGRGVGSGADVEMPLAFLVQFRAGQIAEVSTFLDRREALAAAGLR